MNNKEKYKDIFVRCFNVNEKETDSLAYDISDTWDSVAHMNLIDEIEETFGIIMEPDDIIELNSFQKGIRILGEKYNVEF